MRIHHFKGLILTLLVLLFSCPAQSQVQESGKPHIIPVGLDAYRMWNQWPIQRIGVRAYMRSTYDRSGGNEAADGSHFLFMNDQTHNVTLDVRGQGILYFVRTNHWHGSPWHYIVDGHDYVVKETATAHPVNAIKIYDHTSFIPASAFPQPLAYTWTTSNGADLSWVPIGFAKSLRLAYSRTHYGTGYYIYKMYADESLLSHPIQSWNIHQTPDQDVLNLISKAGTDIAPKNIKKISRTVTLNKKRVLIAKIQSAPSEIRALKLTIPLNKATDLERVRLKVFWDGAEYPSIDAPLCLFFGAGTLYNRDHSKYLVKGFPINIRYDYKHQQVHLNCYFPMPFFKSAVFKLTGITPTDTKIKYQIRYQAYHIPAYQSSYFHATYRDFPDPVLGKDLVLLDTRGIEDHKLWSGSFVGTSFIFSQNAVLSTLEGDPRFFFDGSKSPQAYGTGTEEWAGGGDYWGGQTMTLPFAGHPCGAPSKKEAKTKKDLIESGYRFLLGDLMPFGRRAVIRLEHGGRNLSTQHYETVTYWYGLPAPSLIKTQLDIGDKQSEEKHDYYSLTASKVQQITSRYIGLGIDTFPKHVWEFNPSQLPNYKQKAGKTIFPAQTKDGRYMRGISEFTVHIFPDNYGVLLRRTLDYSFPNQKAKVYVANVSNGSNLTNLRWQYAGIWYMAGSNTVVYSNPEEELGEREYHVETSNRRFRDDEFLIPAKLTRGYSSIRIKIKFIPVHQELYSSHPFPKESAWSAFSYDIYSYVMPDFSIKNQSGE